MLHRMPPQRSSTADSQTLPGVSTGGLWVPTLRLTQCGRRPSPFASPSSSGDRLCAVHRVRTRVGGELWGARSSSLTSLPERAAPDEWDRIVRLQNNPRFGDAIGFYFPNFASGGGFSISPATCGPLGGEWLWGHYGGKHPIGGNPALGGAVRITEVTFVRFMTGSVVMRTNYEGGQKSSDAVPPHYFKRITIDADSRANLAYLPPPLRSWIRPNKCVVMDCDGPKHVLLHDLDGSLTGKGADASITARAEFLHELRQDTTKFTWYNIPTKMLYDPAPYNDLSDPGWDMSRYEAYSDGVQSFAYRRLADEEHHEIQRRTQLWQSRRADAPGNLIAVDDDTTDSTKAASAIAVAVGEGGRQLQSATASDWKNRMVFYTGDERDFYQGLDGRVCEPESAIFDPSCRTMRKTHREVAYSGYGMYRDGCTLNTQWNAWSCAKSSVIPARLIVESMDSDHTSRNLAPVALATGGYVRLYVNRAHAPRNHVATPPHRSLTLNAHVCRLI